MTRIEKQYIATVLEVFDAIAEAGQRYRMCQCSAFRGLVVARAAARIDVREKLYNAVNEPMEKGVEVEEKDLEQMQKMFDGILQAEQIYEYTVEGDLRYREQVEGIGKAMNVRNAAQRLREALEKEETLVKAPKKRSGRVSKK